MLEKIMGLIKGQVINTVDNVSGIPEDKKDATVETTASSLIKGLQKYATPENITSIMSGLGGKSVNAAKSTDGLTTGLETSVVSALTSKVGLSPAIARKIAVTVIPAVMSLLKNKVNDDGEPGFDLGSLVSTLTGKGSGAGSGKGIMSVLGGFLGNK